MKLCPLCESSNAEFIENVDRKSLITLYKKLTGKSFNNLLDRKIEFYCCASCSLKYFYPLIVGNEAFYESLQLIDWYYMADKAEYQFAKKYLKKGDVVLDVGCGKGAFAEYLKDLDAQFIGLEFSAKACELAQEKGVNVEQGSIQDYADANPESVDIVTSFQVIEHVSCVKSFFEAKLQVLKPGGKMIITVPSEDSFLSLVTNGALNMPPHHVSRWSDNVFFYLAERYDINLVEIYHEPLQEIHKKFYLNTFAHNLFMKPKLIDSSLKRKFVSVFSKLLVKILEKRFSSPMLPNGHSVVAVYCKKI
ncbi:MAG: methyltransferase domain-containing protein [Candidatus Electrothrix sp. MAN1_4]|nr:methyltransferase domain-containing protein [Candidatus Electrothrix sp. MAN1_4]